MRNENEHNDRAGEDSPARFASAPDTPPKYHITIWPYRSMPLLGFRRVLMFTAFMLCIPLIPLLGTPVGWALIPFLVATLGLLWFFIDRNYRHGRTTREVVRIWPSVLRVDRYDPNGQHRVWECNPYWVRTKMYENAKIENYLTLIGDGREIELGAFLSPEERVTLHRDIDAALTDLSSA